MKKVLILLSLIGTFSFMSCSSLQSDNRPDIVKQKLSTQIATESQGIFSLATFTKTNGTEKNISGSLSYEMEFSYALRAEKECWKNGNAFVGFFHDYRAISQFPTDFWEKRNWENAKHFTQGQLINLKGTAYLVKKENGWDVERIEIL